MFLVLVSFLILIVPIINGQNFRLSTETLDKAEQKYGSSARKRLIAWEKLITNDTSRTDLEKLEKVNNFFNMMQYVEDIYLWKQKDYWATPIEFLGNQAGDCEDYAIAKYFTLRAMGVDDEKLNLTYVKALTYGVHHMVLAYYPSPGEEPFILDNYETGIHPASKRKDLFPIYSFNGTGLWLAKQRGKGKLAGSSSRLQRWQDVMRKMAQDDLG
ncbi:MAG: transglutaminase-like cysteine peptidase [Deltaproteobacteria bacterium]|nr:transglutaminase-like cysteine peptidase [Deltaproteobacteria bacterium]